MFIEIPVLVKDIQISSNNKAGMIWEEFIETWRMVDEDPDVDVTTTPLYSMYGRYKLAHGMVDRFDPYWHMISKVKLYKQIKEEGFDYTREVRMTASFYRGVFYMSNGHHRMSMLKHWNVKEVILLVRLPRPGNAKVNPTDRVLDIPVEIADMIDADGYRNYQPVVGYNNTTEFRNSVYKGVTESLQSVSWKGKRVLEVGPCFGYYSFWMSKQGAKVISIEENVNRIQICKKLNGYYGHDVEFINNDIVLYDMSEKIDADVLFLINVFHHMLRDYKEDAIGLLQKWNIPEMILTIGTSLGAWSLNLPIPQIPLMILEHTDYTFAKKIGKWMSRDLYYFSL